MCMILMYFIYKHKNKKVAMFEFRADFQTDGLLDISRIMLISIADYFKIRTRYGHYFSVTDIIMFFGVMMHLDKANWLEILISECCSI